MSAPYVKADAWWYALGAPKVEPLEVLRRYEPQIRRELDRDAYVGAYRLEIEEPEPGAAPDPAASIRVSAKVRADLGRSPSHYLAELLSTPLEAIAFVHGFPLEQTDTGQELEPSGPGPADAWQST